MRTGKIELTRMRRKPRDGRDDEGLVAADVVQVAERDREVDLLLFLRGTRQSRNMRRRSDGRVDGVASRRRHLHDVEVRKRAETDAESARKFC